MQLEGPAPLWDKMKIEARKNDFIIWLSICQEQSRLYQDFLLSDEVKSVS